jgi:hypothetical protein
MSHFMHSLQNKGILEKEKQFTIRPKEWAQVARETKLPTYYPIALRTFTEEQMKGPEDAIPIVLQEYLPLDMVAEEIRLLVLMPSEHRDAPLVAHLAHESLYGHAAYNALSYTWGDDEDGGEEMRLSGQSIWLRKNLADALKAIRFTNKSDQIAVWADAMQVFSPFYGLSKTLTENTDVSTKTISLNALAKCPECIRSTRWLTQYLSGSVLRMLPATSRWTLPSAS